MYHRTLLLFLLLSLSSYSYTQNCLNAGFENGSLEGYTTFIGKIYEDGTVKVDIPNFSRSQHRLMHISDGVDPVAFQHCRDNKNLPVVPPEGGEYTLRLGNSGNGAQAERVLLKFTVTPALTFFQLRYAVVLNDPDHEPDEQPRFELRILDENGEPLSCGEYKVRAAENIPGFEPCDDGWRVRPWTTAGFELKSFLGQDIQIEILTTDCARGKHAGYAYFDATCEPLTITLDGYCPGNITAQMRVTEGFIGYKWNTGDTTSAVTLDNPQPSEVYQVTITSATGCTVVLKDTIPTLTDFDIPKFSPERDLTYCRDTSYLFTPKGAHLEEIYSVTHDRVGETFLIDNQTADSYTFIAQGPYECFSDTLTFNIGKGPIAVQSTMDAISCFGDKDGSIALSATSDFMPLQYQWAHGVDSSTIAHLSAGQYTVTVSDNIHCTSTLNFDLQSPPQLSLALLEKQPITCFGASDGQLTASSAGGVGPYDYSWNAIANNTPTLVQLPAGTYSVTTTDSQGCTTIASKTIKAPPPLEIETEMTPISCLGADDGEITFMGSGGVPPYQKFWQEELDLEAESRKNLSSGEYVVAIKDALGCRKEERLFLKELSSYTLCGVYIPTVFSPNGDGINDEFYARSSNDKIVVESMQIFNRWGDLFFKNDNYCPTIGKVDCGWDGRTNHQYVDTGVYVYLIVLRMEGVDRSFSFRGNVTVYY